MSEAPAAKPTFTRPPVEAQNRKQAASSQRVTRLTARYAEHASRHSSPARWSKGAAKNGHAKHNGAIPAKHRATEMAAACTQAATATPAGRPAIRRDRARPSLRQRELLGTATPLRQNRRRSLPRGQLHAGPRPRARKCALKSAPRTEIGSLRWQRAPKLAREVGTDLPLPQGSDRRNADERGTEPLSPWFSVPRDHHRHRRSGRSRQKHHRPTSCAPIRPAESRNRRHVSRVRTEGPARRTAFER